MSGNKIIPKRTIMKKLIVCLIFSLCINSFLFAEKFETTVENSNGEYWWGAATGLGKLQPFGNNLDKFDLVHNNQNNQAAPLLLSNKGRYIWSDQPFAFSIDNGTLKLYSDFESLQPVSTGKTLRDAYLDAMAKHFPPSGVTPNKLMFSMPQYNTWIELAYNQNQKDILEYADNIIKNEFPTGVFMIDDIWQKDYGNFEFDPEKFPDPKGMIKELHDKGFRIMLWLTPFISPDSKEFRLLRDEGALITEKGSNNPAVIYWWDGYSACLDFTKPQAVKWLSTQLKKLQSDYGVDGFKFDAADFHFYYQDKVNAVGTEQAQKFAEVGLQFDFNEYRACWQMGGQALGQRLNDKRYDWNEVRILIPEMLTAGLIGHAYTCPDMIGGGLLSTFRNIDPDKFDQTLIVRSAQIQALMPMMQFSKAPWKILDTAHLNYCRNAAQLHSKMGEYIYQTALQSSKNGEPIVRHMEYAFPNEGFETCQDQFMLGDDYMVAPVVDSKTERTVKLPKGTWTDETGKKYKGGRTISISCPIDRLAYFKRSK